MPEQDAPVLVVKGTYSFNLEQMLKSVKYSNLGMVRPFLRFVVIIACVLMISSAIYGIHRTGFNFSSIVLIGIPLYILVFRSLLRKSIIKKQFLRRPDKEMQIDFQFSGIGLEASSEKSKSNVEWAMVFKVRICKEGFLVYPSERVFWWFPFSAFSSETDRDIAEKVLRDNVPDFAEIR